MAIQPSAHLLEAMMAAQGAAPPNVPILGQKPAGPPPVFQVNVFPMGIEGVPPFEAAMEPSPYMVAPVAPHLTDPHEMMSWLGTSRKNVDTAALHWLMRTIACITVAARSIDPSFHLGNPQWRKKVRELEPKVQPANTLDQSIPTPPAPAPPDDWEAAAKAKFAADNPGFDAHVLDRHDDGAALASMKKNLEEKRFHQDHPQEDIAQHPPGKFAPRHPKVLDEIIVPPSGLVE